MNILPPLALIPALAVAACSAPGASEAAPADTAKLDASGAHPATPLADAPFTVQEIADFNEPWAMTFIRSEEHTSELQSLMRISYAVFCLKKKKHKKSYTQC